MAAPAASLLLLSAVALCTASRASTRSIVQWRSSRAWRRVASVRMQEAQEVLLEGSDLTQTFDGQQYQFRGVDIQLPRGSKQGLVGVNGVGKSSLLRVLAGVDSPESGDVTVSRNVRVAYVEQEPTLPAGSTAADFVYLADAPQMAALREFNAAAEEASGAVEGKEGEAAAARLASASSLMDAADAWGLEVEMRRLCTELGVAHLLERPAHTLSGGQRKRVALAAALLQAPDVLLLDEPTNHLDIDAIRWMEEELRAQKRMCVLVVTHDRAFLSASCDEILELHATALYRHRGDYESFLGAKQARLEAEDHAQAADRNKLRKELDWVRRQPKARSTKSKARLEAYEGLAARVSRVDKPLGSVSLKGGQMQRLGSAVLTCEAITVEVGGRPLLRDFSCELARGARIGVVGPNGAGKSTLLKALQQQLPLAAGTISCGETVQFGYYEQDGLLPSPDQRVLDIVQEAVSDSPGGGEDKVADERAASALLRRFLFPRSRWYARAEKLSGGERRRLQMLQVLARQPNVLLLDEPTNDLDLQTLAALEDFAEGFEGVLLCVSHDRYFLDRVCDQLFILPEPSEVEGGAAVLAWTGRFSDYLEWRDETAARKAASAQAPPAAPPPAAASPPLPPAAAEPSGDAKRGKPLSAFEARSLERLEAEVEAGTQAQSEVQARIAGFDPAKHGYTELTDWNKELETLSAELERTEEKWLELAERS